MQRSAIISDRHMTFAEPTAQIHRGEAAPLALTARTRRPVPRQTMETGVAAIPSPSASFLDRLGLRKLDLMMLAVTALWCAAVLAERLVSF